MREKNPIKATITWNSERREGNKTERGYPHDVCQVQMLKLVIVRDVEEDSLNAALPPS